MPGTVRFGSNTDHNFNQALNMLAQSRTLSVSGLTSAQAGLFAYSAGRLYVLNASAAAFELVATDSDLLQSQNGAFYRARANHTGTQVASTISDFTTATQAISWGSLANPSAQVNAGGQKITNIADGVANTDVASYGQVLALINNQVFKAAARVATVANITSLTSGAPNTLDGVTLAVNDRILVKDQTTGSQNGIYSVTTLGTGANGVWARAGDANANAEVTSGIIIPVTEGTNNGDKLFMLTTNNPIVLDTTSLAFSTYGASSGEIGVGGAGLTKTGSGTVTYDVGQGLGITVAADSVGIDTAVVTRVKRGTVGAGGSATVTINHALALTTNQHVAEVAIIERSTGDRIWCSWTTTDGNNVSVTLPGAPSANQYDWTVVG